MRPFRSGPTPPARETESERSTRDGPAPNRRWRLWLVGGLAAAALLIGGGVWRLLDSTVPVSDYKNVISELDATKESLETTEAALLAERSSLTELGNERPAECPLQTESASLLLGYFAGADPAIVAGHGWWGRNWAGVVARDSAVERIDDPSLTELYWEYIGGGVGDPIEGVANNDFALRLVELTIEPCLQGR